MRAAVLVAALAALVACSGGSPPPAPTLAPPVGQPAPSVTATAPARTSPVPTVADSPRARYQALVGQWQAARDTFLALVTSGRPLSLDAEHAAAQVFLAAERRFAAALAPADWPAAARGALGALRQVSAQMQSHLVAMAQADSKPTFTERLADYSVDVARDNAAVRTVDQILAR